MGLELFTPHSPGAAVTAVKPPDGMNSGVIVKEFRDRFGADDRQRAGLDEGPDCSASRTSATSISSIFSPSWRA